MKDTKAELPTLSSLRRRKRKGVQAETEKQSAVKTKKQLLPSTTFYVLAIGTGILIIAAVVIVHVTKVVTESQIRKSEPPDPEVPLPPSHSILHHFERGAVCSDGPPCSKIGRDILASNGSAVDAAIATLLCNGVVNCHSMGLGGGFLMTLYRGATGAAYALNARETAPTAARPDMFDDPQAARVGPLAVAVPGELAGYWEAHRRFGRLPWARLVEPAVRLCWEGYNMSNHQATALGLRREAITNNTELRELFLDSSTGDFLRRGSRITPRQYCTTLEVVGREGGDALYNGSLALDLLQDIRDMGGIITREDLEKYRVRWEEPVSVQLNGGDRLLCPPPPSSGVLLAFMLNLLQEYNFTADDLSTVDRTVQTYHRIAEAFKFAYAQRTELGDPEFVDVEELVAKLASKEYARSFVSRIKDGSTSQDPQHYGAVYYGEEDHGTAHVSIVAPDGDAVSVTSTLNMYFGAGIVSRRTGIILNSALDDFSSHFHNYFGLPGSPANKIEPGKRPLSSMSPSVLVDRHGDVKLVIGAAGGTTIPTAMAFVMMRHLWFHEDIKEAVDSSRIHHQLFPMQITYEYGILRDVVEGLEKLGHTMVKPRNRCAVVCAISKIGKYLFANADYRKEGDVHGID